MNSGAPAEPLPPGAEPFAAPSSQAVWQSAPAEPLPPGAEPFAAPSSQAARLLPLRMDESILRTPDARKRDQLAVLSETPPQMQLVKRRICVKTTDAENIYGSKKFPQPVVSFCFRCCFVVLFVLLFRFVSAVVCVPCIFTCFSTCLLNVHGF